MMKTNKGFTLVEILLVAFLFSIISAAMFSVLSTGRNSLGAGGSDVTVQQSCRRGLDAMIKELRQSNITTIPDVPPTNDGIYCSTITFKVPLSIDTTGITWSDNIRYSLGGLNGSQLIRTQLESVIVLANDISAIGFNRADTDPSVVNISITAQKNTLPGFTGRQSTVTMTSHVRLRN